MNEFQHGVAQAAEAEQQYRAWQAAQHSGGSQSPVDPQVALEYQRQLEAAANKRESDLLALAARLAAMTDATEQLLAAMTATESFRLGLSLFGAGDPENVRPGWELMVARLCPSLVSSAGKVTFDSFYISRWFANRAVRMNLPSTTFDPIIEHRKVLGGYKNIHEGPRRAWEFAHVVEQQSRGDTWTSSLFILDDGRAMAPRPLNAIVKEQPSLIVNTFVPIVLRRMGQALGLGLAESAE